MTDRVHIGPLTFDGEGKSRWIYSKLRGWAGGAPVRAELENRPDGDGTFGITKALRGGRVLTFEGAVQADTFEEAEADFWDAWAAVQSDGAPFLLSVENNRGIRSCMVTLSGSPDIDETGESPNVAAVTAQFIAFDPVKYGPIRTVGTGLAQAGGGLVYPLHSPDGKLDYGANGDLGRVTLTNGGTASVWPLVRVTGTLTSGFFINKLSTGEVVRYDRVVPAGSTVAVNFRTGEVLVDGLSDGSSYLTRDEFFSIGPKESIEVQFNAIAGSAGTPRADFDIADGWR